jgi:hypothetical protein
MQQFQIEECEVFALRKKARHKINQLISKYL